MSTSEKTLTPPEGFDFTGETRVPKYAEAYQLPGGSVGFATANVAAGHSAYPILKHNFKDCAPDYRLMQFARESYRKHFPSMEAAIEAAEADVLGELVAALKIARIELEFDHLHLPKRDVSVALELTDAVLAKVEHQNQPLTRSES